MTGLTGMTVEARMTRVNSITGMTRTIGMTWMTAHFYLNITKYTLKEQHRGSKLGAGAFFSLKQLFLWVIK